MWFLLACLGTAPAPSWPLTGDVLAVEGAEVEVRHDPVEGLMPEMVMRFVVEGPPPSAGDRIEATLTQGPDGYVLSEVRTVGSRLSPLRDDVPEVWVGQPWPKAELVASDGTPLTLGPGTPPTVLAFLYTRCPNPDFCPALVGRLLALQESLPAGARIVTVTLDPVHDTPEVLAEYGARVGADPARWSLAHAPADSVARLALQAGQDVLQQGDIVVHEHRLVVLDSEGRLVERYDHNRWAVARVARQLRTGLPRGLHPVSSSSPRPAPPR